MIADDVQEKRAQDASEGRFKEADFGKAKRREVAPHPREACFGVRFKICCNPVDISPPVDTRLDSSIGYVIKTGP